MRYFITKSNISNFLQGLRVPDFFWAVGFSDSGYDRAEDFLDMLERNDADVSIFIIPKEAYIKDLDKIISKLKLVIPEAERFQNDMALALYFFNEYCLVFACDYGGADYCQNETEKAFKMIIETVRVAHFSKSQYLSGSLNLYFKDYELIKKHIESILN